MLTVREGGNAPRFTLNRYIAIIPLMDYNKANAVDPYNQISFNKVVFSYWRGYERLLFLFPILTAYQVIA